MSERAFSIGDRVEYSSKFLRSIGWVTGVPRGGTVTALEPLSRETMLASVKWDRGEGPERVNVCNLTLKSELHREAV